MYEDLHICTDVKGKYLGAGGNPICTALARARSLSSCVQLLLTYPNTAIFCVRRFGVTLVIVQCGITYYALYSAPSS